SPIAARCMSCYGAGALVRRSRFASSAITRWGRSRWSLGTSKNSTAFNWGGGRVGIAMLGGTGDQGPGLALRWAKAGKEVIIGSRQKEKGEKVAAELNHELGKELLRGTDNVTAAAAAEVVVMTVPYTAHVSTLESVKAQLQGKIFVDVSVPLDPENARRVIMPAAGSAAEEAQQVLGSA